MHKIIQNDIKYRADIDGLRGIAILSVVVFHAFPNQLPGGFVGVDVFFVVSGFLITRIILRDLELGRFSLVDFYRRRIRRIFPALAVVLLACLAFGWFALFALEYEQLARHVVGGAAFVSNFVLLGDVGYFDVGVYAKPLLHLWSLAIEEQFYLFWPVALLLAARLRPALLVAVIGGLLVISLGIGVWLTPHNPSAAYYLPQARAWQLLAGALLAAPMIQERVLGRWLRGRTGDAVSVCGLALLAISLLVVNKSAYPGWWALLPTAGAAMVVAAGGHAAANRALLSAGPLVAVGLISYPFYLWHWPLLSFASIVESGAVSATARFVLVLVSAGLAWLTYWLIERPVRFGSLRRIAAPALLASMVAIGGFGALVIDRGGLDWRPPDRIGREVVAEFVGPLWQYSQNDACLERYPLEGAEEFGWWFCMLEGEGPDTLLLGTSLANQLYPGLLSVPAFDDRTLLSIGTCDPAAIDADAPIGPEGFSPCSGDRVLRQQELIDGIIRSGDLSYVLLTGLGDPTTSYIDALRRRIDLIEASGARVIIIMPYVMLGYDVRSCFSRPFAATQNDCRLPLSERASLERRYRPMVQSIRASNPGVLFFDPNPVFCGEGGCSMIAEGKPLLRDEYGHWSEFASGKVAELLAEWASVHEPELLRR